MDLLTLIGSSIEELQHSIEFFDKAKPQDGVARLSAVMQEIGRYLARLEDDPILKLAPVDPIVLAERLHGIEEDLSAVIEGFTKPPPLAHTD
jgi:hypothetical protein